MSDRIWITWETQRRNATLSKLLHARLYVFDLKIPPWRRYPQATWKTLSVLVQEKPRIIFAQNPSLVLGWLVALYAALTSKKLVIDAHNAGLRPIEGRYGVLNWMASRLLRLTTITIVSNEELVKHVTALNGRAIAIPDPVPELARPEALAKLKGGFNILFICSWADDEPYGEVLQAAAVINKDICIYITGNSKGKELQPGLSIPDNVVFTGYIAEQEFNSLLFSCDAAMVLTTRENCLLCGAYEGVSAGKPLLLSNTRALRNYFSMGAVYTKNNADSIASAIETVHSKSTELSCSVKSLRDKLRNEYQGIIDKFEQELARQR
jgi:glycosyltransferase involved in cell wall biosynthesis